MLGKATFRLPIRGLYADAELGTQARPEAQNGSRKVDKRYFNTTERIGFLLLGLGSLTASTGTLFSGLPVKK